MENVNSSTCEFQLTGKPLEAANKETGWLRGDQTPIDVYDNVYHQFNPITVIALELDSDAMALAALDIQPQGSKLWS
jgi:hypothetical protein